MGLSFFQNPIITVFILSFVFSLIISLLQRRVFGKEKLKAIKKEIDEINEKLLKLKEPQEELLKKLFELNKILLKENLKVLVVSFILGIIGIYFVKYNYSGSFIRVPIIGSLSVLYFYILLSFIIGIVLSKILVS